MSMIVARMQKMKAENLVGIGNHNQRKTKNHSKDIFLFLEISISGSRNTQKNRRETDFIYKSLGYDDLLD